MTSDKTKTLVLGGGVGGIVVASQLRKLLPREHTITLVEKEPDHRFVPSYLWLMTNERTANQISRPMKAVAKHGIDLVEGIVEKIVPNTRSAVINGNIYSADHLVVALGAEYALEMIPGLAEAGHNLYTLEGSAATRDALQKINKGRIVILISSMPFKCPAAPYEAAMLADSVLRNRGVRNSVEVDVYTPEPGPMAVTGPEVSGQVRSMVEGKGISYFTQYSVKSIDPSQKVIQFTNEKTANYDLLIYVPPHRAAAAARESGLTGESGWIPVDRSTLETRYQGIYAIGDITGIMLSNGKPLPKAGVFAHAQADVVAKNIAQKITGRGPTVKFDGHGACFLEIGGGRAGYGKGNFYAEPAPAVKMKGPNIWWHYGKVALEKYWLFKWF